jgi:hypothetical protein
MILGVNSIGESAVSQQLDEAVGPYLLIGAETETSAVYSYYSEGNLGVLSYSTDYKVYFGGNAGSWIAPLQIGATSIVSHHYNYPVDSYTLEISASYITSATFKFADDAGLEISLVDNVYKSTDPPSEFWRKRPTMMLGPIGFNPLGVEQWLGPDQGLFPFFDTAPIEIAGLTTSSSALSRITLANLEIGDANSQEVTLNELSFPTLEVTGKSTDKGYTFLKQYSYDEVADFTLVAESSESLRINTSAPKQVWFG